MPTIKASFRRGIPFVDLDKVPAIPLRFIVQLGHKLTPPNITDSFCETMIFDHVLDVQALYTDRLVLTYQSCRELVQEVTAPISNTSMYSSDLFADFGSVLTILLFLCMSPLSLCQLLLIFVEELRVAYHLTCREDDEFFQSQVSTYTLFHWRKGFDILFYQQRHEIAVSTILCDGDMTWPCSIRQR